MSKTIKLENGCELRAEDAARFVVTHERGLLAEARVHLDRMANWETTPQKGGFWRGVSLDLASGKMRQDAVELVRGWLGLPVAKPAVSALSEDAVMGWLHEHGMVAVKAEEYKALKRQGNGGVKQIDNDTWKRISRF